MECYHRWQWSSQQKKKSDQVSIRCLIIGEQLCIYATQGMGWLFCVENPYGNESRWLLQLSWYIPTCRYVVRGYGITSWWCIKERHSGIISWCWVFNCIKREQATEYLEGRIGFWKWHEQMEIVFCLQKASGPLTHCWIASNSM